MNVSVGGRFQGNDIHSNVRVGVFVRNPRQTLIVANDIHHNGSGGIQVCKVAREAWFNPS